MTKQVYQRKQTRPKWLLINENTISALHDVKAQLLAVIPRLKALDP